MISLETIWRQYRDVMPTVLFVFLSRNNISSVSDVREIRSCEL